MSLSLKKRIGLEIFRKYRNNATHLHELTYLFWECTLRCNLNCLHCGSDCNKDTQIKDMPAEDFLKTIDTLSPHVNPNKTMIVFTGGEPLLRTDLESCGEQLYQRGFPWGLVTNGLALSQQRLSSLLKSGLRAVTISIDGLETSHNWLRNNKHSFSKAFEAIRLLPEIPDLKYDVVTCVNSQNFSELPALKDLLVKVGIKYWRIFTIFPIGRAANNPMLQLTSSQFRQLLDFIKLTREEKKIDLSYGCEGFLGSYEGSVRDKFFFCQAGINVASILVDGSISACPNLRDNFIQGNIYADNFMDVWENKFQKHRDREWAKTGICADCSSFRYCQGNGLHLRQGENGELLFCHLHKLEMH